MNVILTLFAIVILLPGLVIWILYRLKPKLLWSAPVVILLASVFMFIRDVVSITSEATFAGKWNMYFHNDSSMGFYLIYLPVVVASLIMTLIAYMIKHKKEGHPKKSDAPPSDSL
jgi:uncharacterized membrane protein YeiB